MSLATQMTAEEFLAGDWPRGTQLIAGEVVVNEPKLPHQHALGRAYYRLLAWTDALDGRGYVGLSTDLHVGEDLYAPDVWWVAEARRPGADDLDLEVLPDLVVEVRSPSTWCLDVGRKKAMYESYGVAELWLVDPSARSVLVYRRSAPDATTFDVALEVTGDEPLSSPLLPDFSLPVGVLFDR